jgi:hypothetical protein
MAVPNTFVPPALYQRGSSDLLGTRASRSHTPPVSGVD